MDQAVKSTRKRTGGRASMPIDELSEAIVRDYEKDKVSQKVIWAAKQVLRIIKEDLGVRYADELEKDGTVRRFVEFNERSGIAEITRLSRQAVFNRIIRRAIDLGLLHSAPNLPNRGNTNAFPKAARSLPPSASDVSRLLDHLCIGAGTWEGRRLYAFVGTVLFGGIKPADALRLRVADVDLAGNMIWVRNQWRQQQGTKPPRPVRISADLRIILLGWIRRTKSDWAFPEKGGGRPWSFSHFQPTPAALRWLKEACIAAGIKPVTYEQLLRFHDEHAVSTIGIQGKAYVESSVEPDAKPSIEIGEPGKAAFIRGKEKRPLTATQREPIRILLEAWPDGLSKKAMDQKCGIAWRQNLMRLRKLDADWASAIGFPGSGYPGKQCDLYRILPW